MSRYLGSKIILEENWERYRRRWSSDENNVDDLGDVKEGWIGVVGAPDGPWRRWAAAAVVEDDPFLFFDGSAIWWSFYGFWLVEVKEYESSEENLVNLYIFLFINPEIIEPNANEKL